MLFPETQLWLKVLLAIVTALLIALCTTPVVKTFAERVGAIDVPREARRIHDHPIPRMGGMAIFLGFLISVALYADVTRQVQGILIGSVIIVAVGAVDDTVSMRYWVKLLAQIVAASVAVVHGVVIELLTNPNFFNENQWVLLGALSLPITVLWIVGITNAVNLIDGLDGLACGVSAISCVTMLAVALLVTEGNVAIILAALAGACVGFIPYNLNPAKIFMGDTGALLLGYVLATVSVMGLFKFYAIVTFVVPVLALALPLFDTAFAIIRRLLRGQNPQTPDREHLHHRLIDMGLSQKQAVAVLYSLCAMLGITAVIISTNGPLRVLLLVVDLFLAAAVGIFVVRTIERPAHHPAAEHTNPLAEHYAATHPDFHYEEDLDAQEEKKEASE